MCGIATLFRWDEKQVDPTDIRRMCSAIAHRGPDDAGYALLNNSTVGLGHVRLSIVDLSGGNQPLYNEDASVAVVCNGELYDYPRLRDELSRKGHQFQSNSDSELLVHLYEEYGTDLFDHLNGEFAFALWDQNKQRLIAGRDPCGIKPLFYHKSSKELLLCSEVKGIYALDRIDRKLSLRYLLGPAVGIYVDNACAFENAHSLRPGHYLIADTHGNFREEKYFPTRFPVQEDMPFSEATSSVKEKLTKAVARRLAADVPVHAYLSGGIDSTIVAGLMTRMGAKFTCFNVGFPDSPYDESHKARAIAQYFGQQFETVPCSHERIAENIEKAVYCTEMPLNNYNSIAKMILSGYVRSRGQKVCLTGEGADELFAGYPYFKLEMIWRMQAAGGAERKRGDALKKLLRKLEYRSEGLLWDGSRRWKRAVKMFGYPSFFNIRAKDARTCLGFFFSTDLEIHPENLPINILKNSVPSEYLKGLDPFNKTRLLTFNQLYNIVIPALGDRVEMANSLECRPPFLDPEIIDLARTIPPRHFIDIDRLREKNLLREAFKDLLPPVFEKEHKHPFLAPTWMSFSSTKSGRPLFAEFLSPETIRKVGIFRPDRVSLARFLVNWCPLHRGFRRKVDAFLGTMLNTHLLHHLFVENRIACDPNFPMVNRSPERLKEMKPAA